MSLSSEFPIVSSRSSTLEEPVLVIEEPKEYNAKRSEDIFLVVVSKIALLRLIEDTSLS